MKLRWLAALLAAGCVSTSSTRTGGARTYPPLPYDAEVSVYARDSEVGRRFETLGIVEYNNPGKYQVLTLDSALPPLKDQVRAMGGNGLILDDTQATKSGIFSTGISVRARAIRLDGAPAVAAVSRPPPPRAAPTASPATIASTGAPVELFEDQGQTFLYAGSNQGLAVGSQVVIVGQRIGNTAERRRVGIATVMEVWPTIARVHLDEAAQSARGERHAWLADPSSAPSAATATATATATAPPMVNAPASSSGSLVGHAELQGFGPAVGHRLLVYNDGRTPWTQCDLRLPPTGHYHLTELNPGDSEAILVVKFVAEGSVEGPANALVVSCAQGQATFNLPPS